MVSYVVRQLLFKLVPLYEIIIIDKLWITKRALQINKNFILLSEFPTDEKIVIQKYDFILFIYFLFPDLSRYCKYNIDI